MSEARHLDGEWIMGRAAGTLNEGEALLLASHLSFVPEARAKVAAAEAVGGMLLEGLAPEPLAEDALNRTLARLYDDDPEPAAAPVKSPTKSRGEGSVLPEPLRHWLGHDDVETLRWSFLGPGMRKVTLWRGDNNDKLWMLRAKPGARVPRHGHGGIELTLVLAGSITDRHGTYRRGDVQEMNVADTHGLRVGTEEECICLAYTQGRMRFAGLVARMLQFFLGI
jgi:putative transcriptional regulator